jgi:copper chaperone CopZ
MPTLHATVCQKFTVAGMTCHHCEMAVTAELSKLDGVTSVSVDVAAGTVVTESVAPLDPAAVAAAVDEAGYEVVAGRKS